MGNSHWRQFQGINEGYLVDLYERYQANRLAVDEQTRAFFDANPIPLLKELAAEEEAKTPAGVNAEKIVSVARLAESIRQYGHFAAQLDPLGSPPPGDPLLDPLTHGLEEDTLRRLPASAVGGEAARRATNAYEAIQILQRTYIGRVGHDYLQIRIPEERSWLRSAVESERFIPHLTAEESADLLRRLSEVEVFERFLQRTFPGKTRFSIEGVDLLVPMLDELVRLAGSEGVNHVLIGMAHRGRLNVLTHVLGMPYDAILAEFKDPLERRLRSDDDLGWSGDVKYHLGGRQALNSEGEVAVEITVVPNPSHLESVNPVVEGMARAAGTRANQPGAPVFDPAVTLPVLIHGDAAFPGQGVVAETFNLYRLEGYHTGGTIHIITNNQLGFTTEPHEGRSTIFASDLAKGFRAPILHVNADDPLSCLLSVRLAWAYRQTFHRDFVIDLIGYRRYGHNEGDEPTFTQPRLYAVIEKHPTVREQFARQLILHGEITSDQAEEWVRECETRLQGILERLDPNHALGSPAVSLHSGTADAVQLSTALSLERLEALSQALNRLPPGFNLHPKLARARERRNRWRDDLNWRAIEWAQAEELALGAILEDGVPIRMTGQDVLRGTFSQRHAALFDQVSGKKYIPLQHLPQAKAAFEIHNSPLSEMAALGYEYGYSIHASDRLVIWEAQYGDFINGAQIILDEFISSARAKWLLKPALVLLLPHGYEGQGPDHSSARLERILNLWAEDNLRVVNCTSAAQYFHLLRRQAALLRSDPLPLVVMTPKSLLRHPLVASAAVELTRGSFQPVLVDDTPPAQVRRAILCSGKVAIDLTISEARRQHPETAILRVEELAPFPIVEVAEALLQYPHLEEVRWVQEEPVNMGGWEFVRPYLRKINANRYALTRVSRPRAASPAEGSNALHLYNQQRLLEQAFTEIRSEEGWDEHCD